MTRPAHPHRPRGWTRLVAAEYETAFEDLPDASNRLVANMLGIDETELADCLYRARKYAHRAPRTVYPEDESEQAYAYRVRKRKRDRARYWRLKQGSAA